MLLCTDIDDELIEDPSDVIGDGVDRGSGGGGGMALLDAVDCAEATGIASPIDAKSLRFGRLARLR